MKSLSILLFLIMSSTVLANSVALKALLIKSGFQNQTILRKLEKGNIVVDSEVKDQKGQQSLDFYILGVHPKKCRRVLPKMSYYENYKDWLPFVKESRYIESEQRVVFTLDAKVLPQAMRLDFKIPRIKRPGVYPFQFDKGFLSGLKGTIDAQKLGRKCFIHTRANWKGPHTGFPNLVFELFSEVLTKTGMEMVFRKTKI